MNPRHATSRSLSTLSLSALALACTLGASGCRHRNPMPTPAEQNTLPLPGTGGANPQPQQDAPDAPAAPARKPKPPKPSRDAAPAANADLPVTLSADKAAYRRGETLAFTITLRNASAEPQSLSFTSGQSFDITARRADSAPDSPPAWRWASGRLFTFDLRHVSLRPGEERVFSATWDQSAGDTLPVPRGSYVLSAEIASNPRLASGTITVDLGD